MISTSTILVRTGTHRQQQLRRVLFCAPASRLHCALTHQSSLDRKGDPPHAMSSALAFIPRKVKSKGGSKKGVGVAESQHHAYPRDVLVKLTLKARDEQRPTTTHSIRSSIERLYSHSIEYIDLVHASGEYTEYMLRCPCSSIARHLTHTLQLHMCGGAQPAPLTMTAVYHVVDATEQEQYWSRIKSRRAVRRAIKRQHRGVGEVRRKRARDSQQWARKEAVGEEDTT